MHLMPQYSKPKKILSILFILIAAAFVFMEFVWPFKYSLTHAITSPVTHFLDCSQLSETACKLRPDCSSHYGSRSRNGYDYSFIACSNSDVSSFRLLQAELACKQVGGIMVKDYDYTCYCRFAWNSLEYTACIESELMDILYFSNTPLNL